MEFQPSGWGSVSGIMSNETLNPAELIEDLQDQLHDLKLDYAESKQENQILQKEIEAAEKKYWAQSSEKNGVQTAEQKEKLKALLDQYSAEKLELETRLGASELEKSTLQSIMQKETVERDKTQKTLTLYREKFLQALSIAHFVSNGSYQFLLTPEGKKLLDWADKELESESQHIMKG